MSRFDENFNAHCASCGTRARYSTRKTHCNSELCEGCFLAHLPCYDCDPLGYAEYGDYAEERETTRTLWGLTV